VASLWHLIFHACISAPRGSPRGEAPRAQRFSAHEPLSLFKGAAVPRRLLPRIHNFSSNQSPCPLRSSRRRSPVRPFSPTSLAEKFRRATPRRGSLDPLHLFRSERRSELPLPLLHSLPSAASSLSSGRASPSSSTAAFKLVSRTQRLSPSPHCSWAGRVFTSSFLLLFLLLVDLRGRLDSGKTVFR
jgi:hypothetical protein